MKFVRFDGHRGRMHKGPASMQVGEIVERKGASRALRSFLRTKMRKAMALGMEFSVSEDETGYAIRRDK